MNIIKDICIKYTCQGNICILTGHIYRKGVYYFALQDPERQECSFSGIPERDAGRTGPLKTGARPVHARPGADVFDRTF
jgi:hypothetical protein